MSDFEAVIFIVIVAAMVVQVGAGRPAGQRKSAPEGGQGSQRAVYVRYSNARPCH
jgi:hypothetical protein